jgi:5-methylcytosine-specific restriction endonuclease McrA
LRECVFERDGGVCALCGLNTHRLRRKILRLPFAQRMREIRALQQRGVVHRRRKSWWEADHITAVVEGGDSCLENMRTLCIPCHREVTRGLRARRLQKSAGIEEPDHAQTANDIHFTGSDAVGDRVQHESRDRQA